MSLLISLLMAAPWNTPAQTVPPGGPPSRLVLTGARVLDPLAGRYVPSTVIIEGDYVRAVHVKPGDPLPPDAPRRDLSGMTLVPGLVDFLGRAAPSGPLDADFFALLSLAYGATAMRAEGTREAWLIGRRERIRIAEVVAPRLWLTGQPLGERVASPAFVGARNPDILSVSRENAAQAIARQKAAGVDWIKLSATSGPELLRASVAAAHAAGLKISGEALRVPIVQAAALGLDAIDGTGLPVRSIDVLPAQGATGPPDRRRIVDAAWAQATDNDIAAAVFAMRRRNVALAPLLSADAARALPETVTPTQLQPLPAALRARIEADVRARLPADTAVSRKAHERRLALARAFAKHGGRILAGSGTSDVGFPLPGAAIHLELARLVAAGLTPSDAIRAATTNGAHALGAAKVIGQIRAGYRADLFAVSGDPLQQIGDLSRITLIIRGGEVLERDALLKQATRATGMVK